MAERNNSLEKALSILDMFQDNQRITLTYATKYTGFSIASVNRILNSLENANYIYHDDVDGGYYLADKVFRLGRNTNLNKQLVNVLGDTIKNLSMRVGHSVTLSIRSGNKAVVVLREDPYVGLALIPTLGNSLSLNCSASGKILTAFSECPEKVIDDIDFIKLTPKTITKKEDFAELIERVRSEKIAFDAEEIAEGLFCISVPVLDVNDIAICSISISGYKDRMLRNMYNLIDRIGEARNECENLLR